MFQTSAKPGLGKWETPLRVALRVTGALLVLFVTVASALLTKQARVGSTLQPLVKLEDRWSAPLPPPPPASPTVELPIDDPLADPPERATVPIELAGPIVEPEPEFPLDTRWFCGRPVRPAKTMWMTVTAYTPDELSCGESADGITASLHSVFTNRMRLVAADSKVLPLGSIITVPGYAGDTMVPVLDRGSRIKGDRLDVLFAQNPEAARWGVRRLLVTVWEYADGKGPEDWRKVRDSR